MKNNLSLQHYRCASTSSQTSSHSPMSALSPSSMFTTSNAIEPSEPTIRMDVTESGAVKDFTPVQNPNQHIDTGFDNGHTPTPVVDAVQGQEQLVCSLFIYFKMFLAFFIKFM